MKRYRVIFANGDTLTVLSTSISGAIESARRLNFREIRHVQELPK